jgi:iron complex outermembrane recepter protein
MSAGWLLWESIRMKSQFMLCLSAGSILWLGALHTSRVYAESAAATDSANQLEEVVVTARRREESLSRVPITIAAFTNKQLVDRSITSQEDMQSAVPGLTVRSTNSSNDLNYSIRGQTLVAYSSSSPAVLPYINDVQANTGGTAMIYDLGALQVLKGPQGTLFGRNTTGGAVLFNTATPGEQFGGFFTERLGDYNLRETIAAVDLPINEKILIRIAGDTKRRDGYVTNLFDDDSPKLGQVVQDSIRTTVLLRPVDKLEISTVFQYNDSGGNSANGGVYSVYGPNNTVYSVQSPTGYKPNQGPLTDSVAVNYSPLINGVAGPGTFNRYLAAHPGVDPLGILNYVGVQAANGPYTVDENAPNSHSGTDDVITSTAKIELNDASRIKNIFGFVKSETVDLVDLDGTPFGIYTYLNHPLSGLTTDRRQLSDELQWSGDIGSTLNYIAGVYAAEETIATFNYFGDFDLLPLSPQSDNNLRYRTNDRQEAVFIQTGYNLFELTGIHGLTFNTGFRWTHDKFDLAQLPDSAFAGAPAESTSASKPSWLVGLDYQLTDGLLLYVTQRGSWRTGGINGIAPPKPVTVEDGGNIFLPETTTDVEIGTKFKGNWGSIPVTLNVAAFNQWVKNVQSNTLFTVGTLIGSFTNNIPKAQITGFEIDAVANLTNWLQFGFNGADTYARYTDGHVSYPTFGFSANYGPYEDTPQWTGTAFAQTHFDFEHVAEMVLRADVYAQNYFYFSNLNSTTNPGTKIPGYSLTNLRLELNNVRDSQFSFSVFARNVLNRAYYTGGLATGYSAGINMVNVGEPRMFGVELTYKF